MRGRKIDNSFVSEFIITCSKQGKDTKEAILKVAQEQINFIDDEIKKVELLKKKRSKLCDVLISLQEEKAKDKSKDRKLFNTMRK